VLSDIIMNVWARKVVEKGKGKIMYLCRYVDDCFGIWEGSKE